MAQLKIAKIEISTILSEKISNLNQDDFNHGTR